MFRSSWLKWIALSLCMIFLLGLCACGESSSDPLTESESFDSEQKTEDSNATDTSSNSVITTNPTSGSTTVKPIFEDEFDRDGFVRGDKWTNCTEWIRQDGGSEWKDEMVEFRDGKLVLKAAWNPTTKRVECGAVWTKDRFDTVGGYYEARIKFPVVKGLWGAFWIMAGDVSNVNSSSTDGAEIDVIESIDNDKGAFQSAVHWDGYDSGHQSQSHSLTTPNIYDGEFHVFGFERSKGKYVFYVDGKKTWETTAAGLCSLPGYLMLSLEGTYSRGVGTEESLKKLQIPAEMEIDYVRVYAKRPTNQG